MFAALFSYFLVTVVMASGTLPYPDGPMNTYIRRDCNDSDGNWLLTIGHSTEACTELKNKDMLTTKCCPEGQVGVLKKDKETSECTKVGKELVSICGGKQTCPTIFITEIKNGMTENFTVLSNRKAVPETNACVLRMCFAVNESRTEVYFKKKTGEDGYPAMYKDEMPHLVVKHKSKTIISDSIVILGNKISSSSVEFELSESHAGVTGSHSTHYTTHNKTDRTIDKIRKITLDLTNQQHDDQFPTVLFIKADTRDMAYTMHLFSTIFVYQSKKLLEMAESAKIKIKELVTAHEQADGTIKCQVGNGATPWDSITQESGFMVRPEFKTDASKHDQVAYCEYKLTFTRLRCLPYVRSKLEEDVFADNNAITADTKDDIEIIKLTTTTESTAGTAVTTEPKLTRGLKKLHIILIAGIGGGLVLLAMVIVIVVVRCCPSGKKKNKKNKNKKDKKSGTSNDKSKSTKESGKKLIKKLSEVITVDDPIEDYENINMKNILPSRIYDKAVKDKIPLRLVLNVRKKKK